jgi:ABC-type dipeptide/oligopeptide/nickel transport system permease component
MKAIVKETPPAWAFLGFVGQRFVRLVLTLAVVAVVVFVLLRVVPGDPALSIAGLHASPETVANLRHQLGTDRPLWVQLGAWFADLSSGRLGNSLISGRPVAELLAERLGVTFALALGSLAVALVVGVPLGIVSALRRGTWVDKVGLVLSQVGLALPGFWLGILLLLAFAVAWPVFPLFGASTPAHFVLPSLALGLGMAAVLARHARGALVDELTREYVVAARAGGRTLNDIAWNLCLKNALTPLVTVAGIQFGHILGGAVIIEQVFSLPGVGRLLLTAVVQRDLPLVQGGILFLALVFCVVNFLAEVVLAWADPRVRVH